MPSIDRDLTPLHVVAGLIWDGTRVFITRRHAAAHQGDLWEFPGGKLGAGEEPQQGLARELHEELGITVRSAEPYAKVHYVYPERAVLLDVWRVTAYDGVAHGREGQAACWRDVTALRPSDFPLADRPIVRRLQLPRLYAISNAAAVGLDAFTISLERALDAGLRLVQLREPALDVDAYCAYARKLAALCHRYGAKLLINADPALLAACEADGVQLSARRLASLAARPIEANLLLGASCHNRAELALAQAIEVDFALLSPVEPTPSHPHAIALGWDAFQQLCATTHLPVYALGGLATSDVGRARQAGAIGVAAIRGVWEADDIVAAIKTTLAD
ncbi:MAG: Nudix family hydrolase [Gammaproteobacteria bacterium]